jgi:hypothetical protein
VEIDPVMAGLSFSPSAGTEIEHPDASPDIARTSASRLLGGGRRALY